MTRLIAAPAKINLALRILGRREDGFHELESIFLPLDLGDALTVECRVAPRSRVSLVVEPEDVGPWCEIPGDERNLAYRAAARFLDETKIPLEVEIRLVKRVPVAAGLGGGSSDAAAVLRHLAGANPGAISEARLAALALGLGADVPFFLDPRPAFVRGVGERIDPLPDGPALHLVLVNPGRPLATAEVFAAFGRLAPGVSAPRADLRAEYGRAVTASDPIAALAALVENDLEPAAAQLCSPIRQLRERLLALGAAGAGLSGRGPTVFGLFRSAEAAVAARDRLGGGPAQWARVAIAAKPG